MIRAVLFDAGGTLFRVCGSVGEIYASVAAKHGVQADPAAIELRFASVFRAAPPLCFPNAAAADLPRLEHEWWSVLVREVFAAQRFANFAQFFDELFARFARRESWELFADTLPGLAALRHRGVRLAIVSNFDARLLPICAALGLADYFEATILSSRVGCAKPDPHIFALALQALGVAAGEAIHVGDSLREDVLGARAAGLLGLRIERQLGTAGAEAAALTDLRQVCEVIA